MICSLRDKIAKRVSICLVSVIELPGLWWNEQANTKSH